MSGNIENPYAYRNAPSILPTTGCAPTAKPTFTSCRILLVLVCVIITLGSHYHFFDRLGNQPNVAIDNKYLRRPNKEGLMPADESTMPPRGSVVGSSVLSEPTRFVTSSPTVSPTNEPTLSPTNAPTAPPTAVPTNLPTFAPTAIPTSPPTFSRTAPPKDIIPETKKSLPSSTSPVDIVPTALPTFPPTNIPTAAPTLAPTIDPRQRVIWLKADSGGDIDISGLTAEAAKALDQKDLPPLSCWHALHNLDRKSEDYMQQILFHANHDRPTAPIPLLQRLNFLPASFCKKTANPSESPNSQQTVTSSFSLSKYVNLAASLIAPVFTLPVGYGWQPPISLLTDRPNLQFRTYFFVLFMNNMPLAQPAAIHHICYFTDHRAALPVSFCFFDKQISMQTPQLEFVSGAIQFGASGGDSNYVIASYRLPISNNDGAPEGPFTSVEMMMSGQDTYLSVPGKAPSASITDGMPMEMVRPGAGENFEFVCTDNLVYCRSKFLVAEVIMFEEMLNDASAKSVMDYLNMKYRRSAAGGSLSFELLKSLESAFNEEVQQQAPVAVIPTPTELPRITCSDGQDPFGSAPVDSFQVPPRTSTEDKKKWNDAVMNMRTEIASLKIGGAALRETLKDKVQELQKLRLAIFCPYLDL